MASRFHAASRIAALTVTVTLIASTLASAQTPPLPSPSDGRAQPVLLSAAAFARLAQPASTGAAPTRTLSKLPRPGLLSQAMAVSARFPPAGLTNGQQKSWVSRHKVLIGVFAGVGLVAVICASKSCGVG
jgi:hypothetical protein